jgi:hypothetical protein
MALASCYVQLACSSNMVCRVARSLADTTVINTPHDHHQHVTRSSHSFYGLIGNMAMLIIIIGMPAVCACRRCFVSC